MDEAVARAQKQDGYDRFEMGDYKLGIRLSRFPMRPGEKTALVVQTIGWSGDMDSFKQRPKRSAAFVWDALEDKARRMGKPLYIQSVQIPKLVKSLCNERGYTMIGKELNDEDEFCVVDLVLLN